MQNSAPTSQRVHAPCRSSGHMHVCNELAIHRSCGAGESSVLEDLLIFLGHLGSLHCIAARLDGSLLLEKVGAGLHATLALQPLDQVLVLPAHMRGEVAELAEAAFGAEAKDLQAVWDHHALLPVIGVRDALKGLET